MSNIDKPKVLSLTQFLIDNPQDNVTDEIFLSLRFKEANLPFKISAMTGEQFSDYQKEAIAVGRHRKVAFDSKKFNELVVLNHTVDPCFRNAENIKTAGCATPEQFLYKSLKAGEIVELASQISVLSGFESDSESLVSEVKNS